MTTLARVSENSRRKIPPELKTRILDRYHSEQDATPTSLSREYGVSRRVIHNWLRLSKCYPSQGAEPLRVMPPTVPRPSPRAIEAPGALAPATIKTKPCPSCEAQLPADLSDDGFLKHLSGCIPGIDIPDAPKASQIASRGRRGPVSGQRWYQCDQCGGEFEYLRRGGTCRRCERQING